MGRDFATLYQGAQDFDELDDDQGFARAGSHPERHAVDELLIGQAVIFAGGVVGGKQVGQFAFGCRRPVKRQVQVGFKAKVLIPGQVSVLERGGILQAAARVTGVIFPERQQGVAQGILLIFPQALAAREGSQIKIAPTRWQAAIRQVFNHALQVETGHIRPTRSGV